MTASNSRPNPLFASSAGSGAIASTSTCSRAARYSGCGGVAVAAWLFTAVATGYGVSAADAGVPGSAPSPAAASSSSSADDSAGTRSSGQSSTGATATAPAPAGNGSSTATGSTATGSTATADTASPGATQTSGATSSTVTVAPGVTVSSSGGAHTGATNAGSSTAPTTEPPAGTTDAAAEQPTVPASAGGTPESSHVGTPSPTASAASPKRVASEPTSTPTTNPSVAASPVAATTIVVQSSPAVTESSVAPTARAAVTPAARAAATATVTAPAAPAVAPATGLIGFLNAVVTNVLNPFLAPAPASPEPFTPALWAVLAWVRRNVFNQSPTIAQDPTTSVQTGQTVRGNVGATDPEGDALTYTVTQGPQHGTVSIDQATGMYTYTPNDINYSAAQTDSFTVSVNDGKFNLLGLFTPRGDQTTVAVSVLSPAVARVILNLPDGIASPANPRYSADGNSLYFAGTPTAGGRGEIYRINVDGTGLDCVTCGVTTSETGNLAKPVPVDDGSGRVLILVNVDGKSPRYSILEDGVNGRQIVPVTTPSGGGFAIDKQREMRVSPDGTKVLFTRIVLGPNNLLQALPIVGTLSRTATGYEVTDARVVYATGEGKQWTPDGKGVVILGGQFDAGNVDDIKVDLATGQVTRVTANLDYDEDMDYSPNERWIAIGSTRGLDALTPMTRIVRQNFLPVYVGAPVYLQYALPVNVSNQEWAVEVGDELNRENGIPLFDTGDGYTARSMPSWNPTGDAVAFWESSVTDPAKSRLVIANLTYTTSVGPVQADTSTPNPTWAPQLGTYVATTTPLPGTGTYAGVGGGTAVVSEGPDPVNPSRTIRTVTYTDYVNEGGMVLNGTESADYGVSQTAVHYLANVDVSGTHTGSLTADATINAFQQSVTGSITSVLDGVSQTIPNPAGAAHAQQSA